MPKYLYIVVSKQNDIYYEQAFISMTSLRMHEPNAHIALLTDRDTFETFPNRKADIRTLANEIITERFDSDVTPLKRSRWLKTIMRNKIDSDFLYIDSDTIICEKLSEIENCRFELAAVLDGHKFLQNSIQKTSIYPLLKIVLNRKEFYEYPNYFNGGLLWVKDTERNRIFFEKWHNNWLEYSKIGIPIDQPSLGLTNFQLKFPIKELRGEWNCQICEGANFLHKAKILHYFAVDGVSRYEPFSREMPKRLKETGFLSDEDLALIASPKGFFAERNTIIQGDDFEIYRSNLCGFLRFLYKHKKAFDFLNGLFYLPRYLHRESILMRINRK